MPKNLRGPRRLGAPGAIEQDGGVILQKVVDQHLPAGSSNVRDIPTRFGNTRSDHLPPDQRTVNLNADGAVSTTAPERRSQPSSSAIPCTAQWSPLRIRLAPSSNPALSDQKNLCEVAGHLFDAARLLMDGPVGLRPAQPRRPAHCPKRHSREGQ
jgi:hypothetical protein